MAEVTDGLEIRVETADLRDVAGRLRGDRAATLYPRSAQVNADFAGDPPFGGNSASGYVFVAKTVYAQALRRAQATVAAYTAEVDRIAGATEAAAGNYDQVDSNAALRVSSRAPEVAIPAPRQDDSGRASGPGASGATVERPAGAAPASVAGSESFERPATWCVNWDAYDINALWAMVQGDDIAAGRRQVQTWAAVESALTDQLARLKSYRQTIEAAWPPERSPAAKQFMERLDDLTANMLETAAAAGRTKHAANGIMDALETARTQLEPLVVEYRASANDLIPRQLDGSEDDINVKGRKIMAEAESAVGHHSAGITPPPYFGAGPGDYSGGGDQGFGHGEQPKPNANAGQSWSGRSMVSHNPPAPLPGVNPMMPDGQHWTPGGAGTSGPILSGIGNGTVPSSGLPGGGTGSGPVTPGAGGSASLGGGLLGVLPGAGAGRNGVPGGYARGVPSRGAGVPGVGEGTPGRGSGTGTGRPGAGRIGAPVNGVIGGQPTGGMGASGRGRRGRDGSDRLGDPDVVWEVAEGVVPVIEAGPEPRHDLGPGVIGIDR
ncbi:hypothetical protein [Micromonospora zhanjiangensis]|uniref:PPE family protein n=1 Tax=Micromonospora zhanjiangensis TaxID=1522057 RepID=A0ABV8KNA4_9ACTN